MPTSSQEELEELDVANWPAYVGAADRTEKK